MYILCFQIPKIIKTIWICRGVLQRYMILASWQPSDRSLGPKPNSIRNYFSDFYLSSVSPYIPLISTQVFVLLMCYDHRSFISMRSYNLQKTLKIYHVYVKKYILFIEVNSPYCSKILDCIVFISNHFYIFCNDVKILVECPNKSLDIGCSR